MQASLAELADIESGGNAPQGDEYFNEDGKAFIRVQHFDGDTETVPRWHKITPKAVSDYRLKLFPKGTIVFPKSGASIMMEKRAILPFDAYLVGHLCAMNAKKGTSGRFLYYLLKTIAFSKDSGGTTLPFLNLGSIAKRIVSIPPLPEQKKIASVLAKIWRAVELQYENIHNLQELKKSLMNHLFTCGTFQGKRAMRTTQFGAFPRSWGQKVLSSCSILQTGITKGRHIDARQAIEVPYLRVANVQDGHLNLKEIKNITIKQSELPRYLLQKDDILLTEGGDFDKLGRGFLWEDQIENCVHQNHVFAVRVDRSLLDPRFFAYLSQSQYGKNYFLSVAHKTTNLACINSTKLKAFPVLLPALAEQREISSSLGRIDARINITLERKSALEDLFKTMLNQLMTGKIRVKDLDIDTSEVEIA